jgi:hypothetical protein
MSKESQKPVLVTGEFNKLRTLLEKLISLAVDGCRNRCAKSDPGDCANHQPYAYLSAGGAYGSANRDPNNKAQRKQVTRARFLQLGFS